jgi:hypothetical protein
MERFSRFIIFVAMTIFSVVSMWTTYVSLTDSILPYPTLDLSLWNGIVWNCSVFALALSVALGLMLFALKLAIIDGHKQLSPMGVLGLVIVAFISISFNMDVLYRTANSDFFLYYSNNRMRGVYENYLVDVHRSLVEKREANLKALARQEGELEAETLGQREAPAGYGPRAREEAHQLTLLRKTAQVELAAAEAGLLAEQAADSLLRATQPVSIDEIQALQSRLRISLKETAAISGRPLPDPVRLESPLFAVFERLFDVKSIGYMEIFILAVALLLDLGDIIGYSLVPNRGPRSRLEQADLDAAANRPREPREALWSEAGLPT